MDYGITSDPQLAFQINSVRMEKDFSAYLQNAIDTNRAGPAASEALNLRLKFIRNVLCYRLPRDFMAISKIQADVFTQRNIEPGGFSFFSEQMENPFHDPLLTALDEYGIPTQVSTRIKSSILPSDNLNDLLNKLRHLAIRLDGMQLSPFERSIMKWAIAEM
ncbi:hypothetical protein [Pseudomonas protegens]|uniref:hypothetical protein n=1 Tax=Pseudomonas protegens TaxID=380021 RepID=UPI003209DD26